MQTDEREDLFLELGPQADRIDQLQSALDVLQEDVTQINDRVSDIRAGVFIVMVFAGACAGRVFGSIK